MKRFVPELIRANHDIEDGQQLVQFAVVCLDMSDHLRINAIKLSVEGVNNGLDAGAHDGHAQQLASARHHGYRGLMFGIGQGKNEAGQVISTNQNGRLLRQYASVDTIGLGQSTHRFCKIVRLTRIDHRHRKPCGLQCTGQRSFVYTLFSITTTTPSGFSAAAKAECASTTLSKRWAPNLLPSIATSICA